MGRVGTRAPHLRFAELSLPAERRGTAGIRAIPKLGALSLAGCQRRAGPFPDQSSFFLGESGVKMQHERVGVGSKLGDDERDALSHQAGDEGHIAGEPVELGHEHRALGRPGRRKRFGKLGSAIEGIEPFAGLDLDVLGKERDALGFGKAGDGGLLGFDAEAGAALARGRHAIIRNGLAHQYRSCFTDQTAYHRLPFGHGVECGAHQGNSMLQLRRRRGFSRL